jgi:hypothetical protein
VGHEESDQSLQEPMMVGGEKIDTIFTPTPSSAGSLAGVGRGAELKPWDACHPGSQWGWDLPAPQVVLLES